MPVDHGVKDDPVVVVGELVGVAVLLLALSLKDEQKCCKTLVFFNYRTFSCDPPYSSTPDARRKAVKLFGVTVP